VSWFRTVGARLSLALLVVVLGVLAFVYLLVVPSLQNRLVDSRKDQAATVASRVVDRLRVGDPPSRDLAQGFASASNTRVLIFQIVDRSPLTLSDLVDEGGGGTVVGIETDAVAEAAAQTLTSARGVVLRGVTIPAGKKVLLGYAAANRDPREFGATAEVMDVSRRIPKMLTFSYGTHYCVGASAARLQGRVVLEEMLRRCPDFSVDVAGGRYAEGNYVRRHATLPWRAE